MKVGLGSRGFATPRSTDRRRRARNVRFPLGCQFPLPTHCGHSRGAPTSCMLDNDLTRLREIIAIGGDAVAIDNALVPVSAAQDPRSIEPLLLMLRDDANDHGMWSLLHAAEAYDDKTYVTAFVGALPKIASTAPGWSSILMMRVLNSETSRHELVRQLRDAPRASRVTAASVCEDINRADVRFLAKTTVVLVACK